MEEEEDEDDEDDGSDQSHVSASQLPSKKKHRTSDDNDSLASFTSVPRSPSPVNEAPLVHSSLRSAAPPADRPEDTCANAATEIVRRMPA